MDNLDLKFDKDIKEAAKNLSVDEVRYMVDAYYAMQHDRIRADNQVRALTTSKEPNAAIGWLADNSGKLEKRIEKILDHYTQFTPAGKWLRSVCGIGPVIAAGLLAHIDITQAPTAGHIWSFAGLNPNQKWEKGKKRPWNASLKTLCWKAGESFVKVSGRENDVYGHLYQERKEYEQIKNDQGEYAEQAAASLKRLKTPDSVTATANKAGKLSDGHIHARAKRYAVKQFLADFHGFLYRETFGKEPPLPYPVAHLNHVHVRKAA